jgi:peptidoglycan/xylan/chitin deacetylase (PgdA/CDA1 family)
MLFTSAVLVSAFAALATADIVNKCQSSGMFAMTFDDGPADYTGQLLDTLSKKNVRGTFHLTTQYLTDPNVQSMIKRIAGGGHLIGFRTDPAWDLFSMSDDQIKSAIARSANVLSNFIGYYPKFTRLPYKGWDDRIVRAVEATGLIITQHNIETYDYTGDADRIFNAFQLSISLKGPGGNFISVQRDSIQSSVGVTGKVIDLIKSNGFRLVTLDQCLGMGDMTKNKEPLKGHDGKVAMGPIPEGEITFKNGAKSSGSTGSLPAGDMGDAEGSGVEGKGAKSAADANSISTKLVVFLALVYAVLF